MSTDAKAGWLAAENDTGVPFGVPPGDEDHGCRAGLSDAALTPTDNGSDAPVEDWHESGAEIDAMRNEFSEWKETFIAANPRVRQVWASRRHDIEGEDFRAYWHLTVFFDVPECPCAIGVGDDLEAAGLDAQLEASLKVEAAKAERAAKGATA